MFVTAVCFLFLLKLKWPKNKNIYDAFVLVANAVNASREAVRGLVKSRVEFPPAKLVGFFELCVHQCTRISDWLRALKRQSNVNLYLSTFPREKGLLSNTLLQ